MELWARSLAILQEQMEIRGRWQESAEEWMADTDSTILQFVAFDNQLAKKHFEKKTIRMFSANRTEMEPLSELDVWLNQSAEDVAGQVCALFDQHLIQTAPRLLKFEAFKP